VESKSHLHTRGILKSASLYCTEGRVAVMEVLEAAKGPLTQEQIALRLGKKHLNKVTIYRILKAFSVAGLVHKAFIHKRSSYFELANNCTESQCHPHFTCTSCGQTQCLYGLSVPIINGLKRGFVIRRQQIRLEGLCPRCSIRG